MIITLIAFGILVLGIIGVVACAKDLFSYKINVFAEYIGAICVVIGFLFTIICLSVIIVSHCGIDHQIYQKQLEHESIVKQIECIDSDYEDVSKTDVIQKVYDWNSYVHNAKYWSDNPWTSWFNNKRLADSLKYIELEE